MVRVDRITRRIVFHLFLHLELIYFAAQSQSVSQKSSEDSYLHKFVCSLISNVDNPMWLFEVVKEVTLTSVKCYNHLRDDIFVHRDKLEIKSKFCIGLLDSFLLLLFFFFGRERSGFSHHVFAMQS